MKTSFTRSRHGCCSSGSTGPDARGCEGKLEHAGCAVEVATTADEALECMAVMTPALIIIEEIPASPGARDFLDGARLIGVDAASDRDIVCEQLAEYRQRDGSQLFRQT